MNLPDYADPMLSASEEYLRKILLTVDGQGKTAKERALQELLRREKEKAVSP